MTYVNNQQDEINVVG